MNSKFHINNKGNVGRCTASIRPCIFESSDHFDSKTEALEAVSNRLEKGFSASLAGISKTPKNNRSPREIPLPEIPELSESETRLKRNPEPFKVVEIPVIDGDWRYESLVKDSNFVIHSARNDIGFALRMPSPGRLTGDYNKRLEGFVEQMDKSIAHAGITQRIDSDKREDLVHELEVFKNFVHKVSTSNDLTSDKKIKAINAEVKDLSESINEAMDRKLTEEQQEEELNEAMKIVHTPESIKSMIGYYDLGGYESDESHGFNHFQLSTRKPVYKTYPATVNERATYVDTGDIRPVRTEFGLIQTYGRVVNDDDKTHYLEFRVNNQWWRTDNWGDPYEINVPDTVDPQTGHLKSTGLFGGIKDIFRAMERKRNLTKV